MDKMEIVKVSDFLQEYELEEPQLNVLIADDNPYQTMLFQPKGIIEASSEGIMNKDRELASSQFSEFLNIVNAQQPDLVITPEYSMPWEILVENIINGGLPGKGKLWVFGCESIKFDTLNEYKDKLSEHLLLIHEPINSDLTGFYSPLVYLFQAPLKEETGRTRNVALVQFKTCSMGGRNHLECFNMEKGKQIYKFGKDSTVKLVSIICADAFSLTDEPARNIYDRALILHLQLNPYPRHTLFTGSRERLLKYDKDETEIICLNWASDVISYAEGSRKNWDNISGSAWYIKSNQLDQRDITINKNHKLGLYYTRLQKRRTHVLFFNYRPAIFNLKATKVCHIGMHGARPPRFGPTVSWVKEWDDEAKCWKTQEKINDCFPSVLDQCCQAKDKIQRIAEGNQIAAERLLALVAGKISLNDRCWYEIDKLDSCMIEEDEIIRRITFAQDKDRGAKQFRISRLKRCDNACRILSDSVLLPPALFDLSNGFEFEWSATNPHQNVISMSGVRATVMYLGEEASQDDIENIAKVIFEYLRISIPDRDKRLSAQQRVAIWYRSDNGKISLLKNDRYISYNQTRDNSELDIGRES